MNFLLNSDLFYIIVIRKGSFGFGTFGIGWKLQQRTVGGEIATFFLKKKFESILSIITVQQNTFYLPDLKRQPKSTFDYIAYHVRAIKSPLSISDCPS